MYNFNKIWLYVKTNECNIYRLCEYMINDVICTKCNIYCMCVCMIKVMNHWFERLNVGLWICRLSFPWRLAADGKVSGLIWRLVADGKDLHFSWRLPTDGKVLYFSWRFHTDGKVLYFSWRVPTDGEGFRDGKGKNDAEALSWRLEPSGNNRWRFSVREDGLSLSVCPWRSIPDGYRHGILSLTVSGTFRDGSVRQEKNWLG
jgi:hypothetical protein